MYKKLSTKWFFLLVGTNYFADNVMSPYLISSDNCSAYAQYVCATHPVLKLKIVLLHALEKQKRIVYNKVAGDTQW